MLLATRALVQNCLREDAGWIFIKEHLFNSVNFIVILGDHQVVLKALFVSTPQSPLRLVHLLSFDILNDFKSCLKSHSQVVNIYFKHGHIFKVKPLNLVLKPRPDFYIVVF